LNVTYGRVTATMEDFIAAEYSDIFQQSQILDGKQMQPGARKWSVNGSNLSKERKLLQ